MTMRATLLMLVLASPALAHLVPVAPGTCALDLRLDAPIAGAAAIVDPPAAGDLLRASYTPDANSERSLMQLCAADPVDPSHRCAAAFPPRGFVAGGVPGSITLPSAFALRVLANGDLSAASVPIAIAVGASPPVTVPFELATGLLAFGSAVFSGAPLDATGTFTIIGAGSSTALPAPFGGTPLRIALACTLAPPPDLDQFALPPSLDKVRGVLTTKKVKLTLVVESEVTLPADFAGLPTILQVGPSGAPLLAGVVALSAGARGRFASSDGAVTLKPLRSRTARLVKIVVRGAVDPGTTYASGQSDVAVSSGGLMASRGVSLKANRRGTRLVIHER